MDTIPDNPAERLHSIQDRIGRAIERFDPDSGRRVTLVAVSKTVSADRIEPYILAGQTVFGENRVQEAKEKWPLLRQRHPEVRLHLIGPLQTNKLKDAIELFDVIETVDRDKLAALIRPAMEAAGRRPGLFVQVNVGEESQKSGIFPRETTAFVERCRRVHGLDIEGLMCIPPAEAAAGPYFAQLAALGREADVRSLSMGMSGDFETAIFMGATHVRVGTALFGMR